MNIESLEQKKMRLEDALYNWLDEVENVENDITKLLETNDISRSQIAKSIDKMECKLVTVKNNLKKY